MEVNKQYLQLLALSFGPSAEILRLYLEDKALQVNHNGDFISFLNDPTVKHILFHQYISKLSCCKCDNKSKMAWPKKKRCLDETQFLLLFKQIQHVQDDSNHEIRIGQTIIRHCLCKYAAEPLVEISALDIPLLSVILKTCFMPGTLPGYPNWLERIKKIQKYVMYVVHKRSNEIKESELKSELRSKWKTLEAAICGYAGVFGTCMKEKFKKEINELKEKSNDDLQRYFSKLMQFPQCVTQLETSLTKTMPELKRRCTMEQDNYSNKKVYKRLEKVKKKQYSELEYFTKRLVDKTCIEGDTVQLECEVLEENQIALWFKDGAEISTSDKYKVEKRGKLHRLVVNHTTSNDEGEYSVKINNYVQCSVLEVQEYFTKRLVDTSCIEGDTVQLECEVHVLKENQIALWFKDGAEISTSDKYKVEKYGKLHRPVVNHITSNDKGEYSVKINNYVQCSDLKVQEYVTKRLVDKTCIEGDTVQLACEVLEENQTALWFKDGTEIKTSDKYILERHGKFHRLVVNNATSDDEGNYTVKIKNCIESSKLIVHEFFTKRLVDKTCIEGDTVQLECEVLKENQTAQWFKDGTEIKTSDKYILERHGKLHRLVVNHTTSNDEGEYSVKMKNFVRRSELKVIEYFTKPLADKTCREGDTVRLECEVLQENLTAQWFKDGTEINSSDKYILERHGKFHRLVVNNATSDDEGNYSVKIKNCVQSSKLIVHGLIDRYQMSSVCKEIGKKLYLVYNTIFTKEPRTSYSKLSNSLPATDSSGLRLKLAACKDKICRISSFSLKYFGENVSIRSGCFMPNGNLLLLDYRNKYIYTCTVYGSEIKKIKLQVFPTGITVYNPNVALVATSGGIHTLNLMSFTLDKPVKAGACWAISSAEDTIWIGVKDVLCKMTINGEVQDTFSLPFDIDDICVGTSGDIYLLKLLGKAVYKVSTDHSYKIIFENTALNSIIGLSLGNEKNLFIAEPMGNNIHYITHDGQHSKVILTAADGIRRPIGLSFNRESKHLIILNENGTSINTYTMH